MILVVGLYQILKDRARLKNCELLAVRALIGDGGDPPVGVDLEEPVLLLLQLGKVEGLVLRKLGSCPRTPNWLDVHRTVGRAPPGRWRP